MGVYNVAKGALSPGPGKLCPPSRKGTGGLKINSDKACIQMGPKGDVSICRAGDDTLEISGDLTVEGDIKVNGKSLKLLTSAYQKLAQLVADLESKVKKASTTTKATNAPTTTKATNAPTTTKTK